MQNMSPHTLTHESAGHTLRLMAGLLTCRPAQTPSRHMPCCVSRVSMTATCGGSPHIHGQWQKMFATVIRTAHSSGTVRDLHPCSLLTAVCMGGPQLVNILSACKVSFFYVKNVSRQPVFFERTHICINFASWRGACREALRGGSGFLKTKGVFNDTIKDSFMTFEESFMKTQRCCP